MNNVKVLVFPCGTEVGLEIHNSLRFTRNIKLFGANSFPDHGKFVYKNYIEGIPFVDKSNFIREIKKVIKEKKIDFVFPAHDSVILKLAQERNLGCKLITSPLKTCQICRSKRKTYQFFSSKLRVPWICKISDRNIYYPVFLKPEVGQGTRGTYIANSRKELEFYLEKDPSLMILEYLPGKEYTVDCFTDKHRKLRFIGPRERARILGGISVNSYPVENPKFLEIAEIVNSRLELRGVWFFQVKESKNKELTLMEIAPRVGGTMGLTRNLGVNLPLLSVFDAMDENVEIIRHKHQVEIDRALISRYKTSLKYKHVYIDFDDTIELNHKINPWIIAFLYQCINRGIKLHLLSRHIETYGRKVKVGLEKWRLSELFDEVIDISDEKEKYEYIKKEASIFIDESFSERKKVSDKLKIPTFDTHEIESLINWKY